MIVSPRAYNVKARLAVACPVTSHVKGYPFEVALPAVYALFDAAHAPDRAQQVEAE